MASMASQVGVEGEDQEAVKEQNGAPDLAADDTASSSRGEGEGDEEEYDGDDPPMPLLSYTRLLGSLPRRPEATESDRTISFRSTCAVMGQVNLSQQDPSASSTAPFAGAASSPGPNRDLSRTPEISRRQSSQPLYYVPYGDPLLSQQPHYVMALGYENGAVDLVDSRTGVAVVPPQQLRLRESTHHQEEAVVDISIDSTGSFLAAVDTGRMAVIWEFRYTISTSGSNFMASPTQAPASQQQQEAPPTPADSGVFSSFMSALTLGGATPTIPPTPSMPSQTSSTPQATTDASRVPRLSTSSIQLSRITYPKSFGVATCIAIDPTYKRKRDKAVLVGFLDGRLVLTKRGSIFQRRTDAIIYQGTYHESSQGIEAIEWRGSFAAWADATGIRIFDTESMTRIAQIDRPTGARPSLYPTLSSLCPSLCFETSNYLLVAWGDCLMGLTIGRPTAVIEESAPAQQTHQQPKVECAMAWELDCVASGVVPLDNDHVLILGLVPPCDEDDETNGFDSNGNDLEVQIVAKEDGSILFSNILPVPQNRATQAVVRESAADYTLLSSFAMPRMEDAFEAEMMEDEPIVDDAFDLQVSLFSPSTQQMRRFVDPHLKWSLNATSFDEVVERVDTHTQGGGDDDNSVDSDDYDFIFRPLSTTLEEEAPSELSLATPPLMIIVSTSDVVLASMRDIDDAVGHALGAGKSALALQRGLHQKRRLRRYDKNDLVNEYFLSLLMIPRNEFENGNDGGIKRNPLSIRRLKLAAKAMPVLFGGEVHLWERWIAELQKIPGALFLASDQIPVRDPKLPKEVYGSVLASMLKEIYEMNAAEDTNDAKGKESFIEKGEQMFLNVLTGWGPTNFLKEHIKHCKYDGRSKAAGDAIKDAEYRFARRFTQTSARYLSFPVSREESQSNDSAPRIRSEGYCDSKRSLFDIDDLIEIVNPSAPLTTGIGATYAATSVKATENNARVALDAMTRLYMMKGQYDAALKSFISIGALHFARPLSDFKSGAVDFSDNVGNRQVDKPWHSDNGVPYTFLLDIIDSHHLQQCLLDEHFLSNSKNSKKVVPIFSLLQLVGFHEMGNFLIEHCVPPQMTEHATAAIREEKRGTLPLDLVAAQMETSPRLLHWYLHLVFTRKPEVYVRFPNTAYPPRAVTELHRAHFDLHLDFAGKERDSADALSGIEAYKVSSVETRLLRFLKATLPLGGIRIQDAKKSLESKRDKDEKGGFSTSFALELAFIIEHYGEDTEAEAEEVLELYMRGTKSLVLAVSFAQRSRSYSSRLWKSLIEHCLEQESGKGSSKLDQLDGSLFGALLEAAALSGADLAHLVTQIPPGMAIEGLRPRLVAAVADYRLKLKMHEAASEAATQEMISILRELSHRSRRGARYKISSEPAQKANDTTEGRRGDEEHANDEKLTSQSRLPWNLRTSERRDRHRLGIAPPIR